MKSKLFLNVYYISCTPEVLKCPPPTGTKCLKKTLVIFDNNNCDYSVQVATSRIKNDGRS